MDEKKQKQIKIIILLVIVIISMAAVYYVAYIIHPASSSDNTSSVRDAGVSNVSSETIPQETLSPAKVTSAATKEGVTSQDEYSSVSSSKVTTTREAPTSNTVTPTTTATATTYPSSKPSATSTKSADNKSTKEPVKKTTTQPSDTQSRQEDLESDIKAILSDSVFIGDSVMYGFELYCKRQGSGYLGGPQFLASGCFSTYHALANASTDSVTPEYKGVKRQIWDSVSLIDPSYVFIDLGLNDIGAGVDRTYSNYVKVIEKILNKNDCVNIVVISTTPVYPGSERGALNNENIDALNEKMKEYVQTIDGYFIDISSHLKDDNGTLKRDYCSDHYVHLTNSAYKVWAEQIENFAEQLIKSA